MQWCECRKEYEVEAEVKTERKCQEEEKTARVKEGLEWQIELECDSKTGILWERRDLKVV